MAINMYSDSSSVSTLFSGLSKSATGLESAISQYAMLRSGATGRLAKAVYAQQAAESGASSSSAKKASDYDYYDHKDAKTSKGEYSYYDYKTGKIEKRGSDQTKTDKTAEESTAASTAATGTTQQTKDELSATSDLISSSKALTQTGSSSVFNKKTVTAEDGTKTEDYDTDKIKKAVSDYIKDYNSLIETAAKSDNKSIVSYGKNLQSLTKSESSLLEKAGISIDKDTGKLSMDEEKFEKADMSTVKTLFNGNNSYAYQAASKASMMNYYAVNDTSQTATSYDASGSKTSNYSVGDLWSQYV